MKVYELNEESAGVVAELMHRIKPEWWPTFREAYGQLADIDQTIKTVGWYLGEDAGAPKGWILCRELVGYRALEVECSGFDDHGVFKLEHKLDELFLVAEAYAREKGYLTFRSGISSQGFNIHERTLDDISGAIAGLQSSRVDYLWYLDHGFRVIGIQPNAYRPGFHLILLGKDLS